MNFLEKSIDEVEKALEKANKCLINNDYINGLMAVERGRFILSYIPPYYLSSYYEQLIDLEHQFRDIRNSNRDNISNDDIRDLYDRWR